MTPRQLLISVSCIAATLMCCASAHGDDVVLRSAARVPVGANVLTLADVAALEGAYAQSLGGVVVLELNGPDRVIELSVQDVRHRLDEAGAHWGKVNLQGSRVVIRPRTASAGSPPIAMQPVSLRGAAASRPEQPAGPVYHTVSEFADESTVRGAIGRAIADGLGLSANDVQLAFDARDEALLATTASAFRIEVEAVSSLRSDRIQMVVRLWEGLRVAQNASLTVLPLVRSTAVCAARDLSGGSKLLANDVRIEDVWISPNRTGWLTSVNDVVDQVLERNVSAGERIAPKHLRKHIIINRGDRAIIRCLVGGIVISMEAECRQAGAEGDSVEFRKLGERDTFFATVTGPGEAVLDLSTQQ